MLPNATLPTSRTMPFAKIHLNALLLEVTQGQQVHPETFDQNHESTPGIAITHHASMQSFLSVLPSIQEHARFC